MQNNINQDVKKQDGNSFYLRYYPWLFIFISYGISFLHLYVREMLNEPTTEQFIMVGMGFGFVIVPLMAWSIRSPIKGVKRKIKAHSSKLHFVTSGLVTMLFIFLFGCASAVPAMVLSQLGWNPAGLAASMLFPPCPIVFLPVVIGFANNKGNSDLFDGFNTILTLIGYDVEVTGPDSE